LKCVADHQRTSAQENGAFSGHFQHSPEDEGRKKAGRAKKEGDPSEKYGDLMGITYLMGYYSPILDDLGVSPC
jgi:hypothetical protein